MMDEAVLLELLAAHGHRLAPGRTYDVVLKHEGDCGLWGNEERCTCNPEIKVKEVRCDCSRSKNPVLPDEP